VKQAHHLAITALAQYLTGSRVIDYSIGLKLGGQAKDRAEAFFALRRAWGVQGYDTPQEAERTIRTILYEGIAV